MNLIKKLSLTILISLTGNTYALDVVDKQKFGSYFKPVKVHNQAEFDYIHLLLSYMGVDKSLKLLESATTEAEKIIKVSNMCASIGFSHAHTDFIELNKQFSKKISYDSDEQIDMRAKKYGISPSDCEMVKDHIRKNPAKFIEAYSK
ncbi:hypothetical protein ACG9X1_17285 [Acinetobacter baumannii]|uniref:hypothetical protein n=1 Tax=Acinetobacter TaxID=469 RepID=UPI0019A7D51D|nr:hypothetical protein [Acinetobacter sp.]MBC6675686.1 hypothetical protein [Acinetobacter sp.]